MSLEKAMRALAAAGFPLERIRTFSVSSATVELAAGAVGTEPARIAKTLAFRTPEGPLLLVAAGDARADNAAYRARFGCKARMLPREETEEAVGYAPGGVCPFSANPGVRIFLDVSLRRFETVFPACGTDSSAVEITCGELFSVSGAEAWVDVCRGWQTGEEAAPCPPSA